MQTSEEDCASIHVSIHASIHSYEILHSLLPRNMLQGNQAVTPTISAKEIQLLGMVKTLTTLVLLVTQPISYAPYIQAKTNYLHFSEDVLCSICLGTALPNAPLTSLAEQLCTPAMHALFSVAFLLGYN